MRVAKPDQEILDAVTGFIHAAELMLEKGNFSLQCPYENCNDLDDDDEDKQIIIRLRKFIAANEEVEESEIDGRIVAYEYLRRKYSNRLGHLNMTAHVLLDNCCDPNKDYLDFHPSFEQRHVAAEQ